MALTSQSSKRVVHDVYGDPASVLRLESTPPSASLQPGHAVVRVTRAPIHPGDLHLVAGRIPGVNADPITGGRVPGFEASGIIEGAAPHALAGTTLAVGSRVAFFAPGAWQSLKVVAVESLVAIPDDVSDSVASQILINTIAARIALRAVARELDPVPSTVLLTGAASAVGKIIAAMTLERGITPVRLVRSAQTAAELERALPGGIILDTSSPNWQADVHDATPHGVSLAFDAVGGAMTTSLASLVSPGGVIVFYGALDYSPSDISLFIPKALTLKGITIGRWHQSATPAERISDVAAAVSIAKTNPALFGGYREFDAADLGQAVSAVSARGKTGNIILRF